MVDSGVSYKFSYLVGFFNRAVGLEKFNCDFDNEPKEIWLPVTCFCCPYLYFGSPIILVKFR